LGVPNRQTKRPRRERPFARSGRPSIALAAQLLDQGIEFVLDDTDGAGADPDLTQPAGLDKAFVKGGLADAETLEHLAFSQDPLANHI
jgi:hypothetical protein